MKKIFIIAFTMLTFFSCEKEDKIDDFYGLYTSSCRLVQYKIDHTGIYDSTVYERQFMVEVLDYDQKGNIYIKLPTLLKILYKVESNKIGIERYEDLFESVPDGIPDTISLEYNRIKRKIDIQHIGYTKYFFPSDTVFTTVVYNEVCHGFKKDI